MSKVLCTLGDNKMKRIIPIFLFTQLLLLENTTAQSNFDILLGGGYVTYSLDKTKLPYWENGYLINFSSDYEITERISLFFSSSFQQHYFNSRLVDVVVPAVEGYRYSVSGDNSTVIELSVGSRFYLNGTIIKPYLGVGTGLLLINQGKVEIANWREGNPIRVTGLYSNSEKIFFVSQINIGLGLEVGIINNFSLVLEGKLINGFDGPSYFPLTASIKIGI